MDSRDREGASDLDDAVDLAASGIAVEIDAFAAPVIIESPSLPAHAPPSQRTLG